MVSSNIQLKVDNKMKCFIQLARKTIVDLLEEEIEKTDNEELRSALTDKVTEVLECDLVVYRPKQVVISVLNINQKLPKEPVTVKGTPLKVKNMSNPLVYRNFCASVANLANYAPDFSDSPFSNYNRNSRVYEAIKRLYTSGRIDQETLDTLVQEAEDSETSVQSEKNESNDD